MFVVFDLDGTLADCTHREHFLRRPVGQKKDWEGFHAAAVDDPARRAILKTNWAFGEAECGIVHRVEIWTGRDERHRDATILWLKSFFVRCDRLLMRPTGDKTEDHILKAQWADQYGNPGLVFEDRQRVVDMWRARGVTCCQVAPGDF